MKQQRIFMCFVVFIILISLNGIVLAVENTIHVSELYKEVQEMKIWKGEYTVENHKVNINTRIIMPDIDSVKILKCQRMEVSKSFFDNIQKYESSQYNDGILSFDIQNYENDVRYLGILEKDRFELYYNSPSILLSYKPNDFLKTEKQRLDTLTIDENREYAENSNMTIEKSKQLLTNILEDVYEKNVEYCFKTIDVKSRGRKTKGMNDMELGDTVDYYPKGTYLLNCYQSFNNIPVLLSSKQMYSVRGTDVQWPNRINEFPYTNQHLWMEVMSEDSYAIGGSVNEIIDVVNDDIPLSDLQSVIKSLEKLIYSGNIRNVYSFEFGYGIFLGKEKGDFFLYPIWMIECSYAYNPDDEILMVDDVQSENQLGHGFVVVNAQTGVCFEHPLIISNRDIECPQIIEY